MLLLGVLAFFAGILLVAGNARARISRHRKEQVFLQGQCHSLMARLTAVEAHVPLAMVMMDARGLIRRVNLAAESLFGYTEEELLGQNILRLLPFAPSALNPAAARAAVADGEGAVHMEVRCKDRSTVKVRMTGACADSEAQPDFYMFFEAQAVASITPQQGSRSRAAGANG